MVPFLSWLFDNRKNPSTILEQSNFSLTRLAEVAPGYGSKQFTQFYSRLKNLDKRGKLTDDIAKADAVRKILKPNILAAATDRQCLLLKKQEHLGQLCLILLVSKVGLVLMLKDSLVKSMIIHNLM